MGSPMRNGMPRARILLPWGSNLINSAMHVDGNAGWAWKEVWHGDGLRWAMLEDNGVGESPERFRRGVREPCPAGSAASSF